MAFSLKLYTTYDVTNLALANHQNRLLVTSNEPVSTDDHYSQYSQALIRKLEAKMIQLEEANRSLERDIAERKRVEEALRESEARFRVIFEHANDAIHVDSTDDHILEVNPRMCEMTGYSREELLTMCVSDLQAPEVRGVPGQVVRSELARHGSAMFEGVNLHRSGRRIPVELSVARVHGAQGDLFVTIVRDITERKQAEAALATERTLLRTLVDNLPDSVYAKDLQGRKTLANRADLHKMGVATEAEALGKTDSEIFPPDLAAIFAADDQQVIRTGQPVFNREEHVTLSDGRLGWQLTDKVPLRDHTGQVIGLIGIGHDITERKRSETEREQLLARVQAQAEQITQIVESVPEGMLLLDAAGQVLLTNPAARRDLAVLTGAEISARVTVLGGRPLAELMAPPPSGPWHELHAGSRTIALTAQPISSAAAPGSWLFVTNDITELREQQRYREAQERLATVGQLAAGIAHDFNNIMGAIMLYAGLLEKASELPPRYLRYVATIRQQADHAANLIRQILDFSRRAPMERNAHDLLSQVKELIKLLERTLHEDIKLYVRYDRNEYIVQADPTRLQQALMNLALNARDAMPQGGQLTFSLSALALAPGQPTPLPDLKPGSWVRMEVADTGTGILPEHMQHVFEPFFTTKAPGHGTGLGLAQVYGIVKQHDGAIDVTSQVGVGTTFAIFLPLHVDPASDAPLAVSAHPATGSATILLVEDNAAARVAMREALRGLGYRVVTAGSGHEALAALAAPGHGVHLVISDMVMPEMGGLELYRRLRITHPEIKLIFMTGYVLAENGDEELTLAGVPWLRKPFAVADLAAAVWRVLNNAPDL